MLWTFAARFFIKSSMIIKQRMQIDSFFLCHPLTWENYSYKTKKLGMTPTFWGGEASLICITFAQWYDQYDLWSKFWIGQLRFAFVYPLPGPVGQCACLTFFQMGLLNKPSVQCIEIEKKHDHITAFCDGSPFCPCLWLSSSSLTFYYMIIPESATLFLNSLVSPPPSLVSFIAFS